MPRLILILAVLAILYLLLRLFIRTPPKQLVRLLKRAALWLLAGLLIFAVLTGRAHWLFAVIGAALPFLKRVLSLLPLLRRVLNTPGIGQPGVGPTASPAGQQSTIRTRFLHVSLDHQSGNMTGEVLEGAFAGRQLADLAMAQLAALYREVRGDAQSAAVLEAYLDRMHGDAWRETAGADPGSPPPSRADMSREEAYQILGLPDGANNSEIKSAHRRLIQKLHPDRGGSAWLAARINQAKDILLS